MITIGADVGVVSFQNVPHHTIITNLIYHVISKTYLVVI